MVAKFSLEKAWLPTFFFLDSNGFCQDLLLPHKIPLYCLWSAQINRD